MTKLDHTAALVFAETYKTYTTGQEQPRNYNLAAAYIDLTQQLAEEKKLSEAISQDCNDCANERNKYHAQLAALRKAARDSLYLHDMYDVRYSGAEQVREADAALRKLLEKTT